LGQNYKSIPVNCPHATSNYHRSGAATTDANGGSAPNYPSSAEPMKYAKRPYTLEQIADKHEGAGVVWTTSEIADLDFEQPRCVSLGSRSSSTMLTLLLHILRLPQCPLRARL
jgi:catalase